MSSRHSLNSRLITSNIKISVKVRIPRSSLESFKTLRGFTKETYSFFVHRRRRLVYTFYYSGHVNVTGIKKKFDLQKILKFLYSIDGFEKVTQIHVDNVTVTGCVSPLHLTSNFRQQLYSIAKLGLFDSIAYKRQSFPGAFLKKKQVGTIVFFSSGKFNIVGCRSRLQVRDLIDRFSRALIFSRDAEKEGAGR